MKKAIDYYIANTTMMLEDVSKLFDVYPDNLSKNLRLLGYKITDRRNIPQFNEKIFDRIDTEEKAYWLGFIFADGFIQSPTVTKFKHYFGIGLAVKDISHLQKFNTFMQCKINKVRVDKYLQLGKMKTRCVWGCANTHL